MFLHQLRHEGERFARAKAAIGGRRPERGGFPLLCVVNPARCPRVLRVGGGLLINADYFGDRSGRANELLMRLHGRLAVNRAGKTWESHCDEQKPVCELHGTRQKLCPGRRPQ